MKIKAKFTKLQIQIIILLGAIAVLMLGGALLIDFGAHVSAAVPPVEHVKERTARPSLSPYFNREINIGGSGDETLSDVFSYDGKLYIFGSTSSTDRDFDSEGGAFLAILNGDGSTNTFKQYGGSGDRLVRAVLCEGGFMLAINKSGGGSSLIKIDYAGEAVKSADTTGISGETFADLKGYESRVVGVTSVTESATGLTNLKARVYDYELNVVAERAFPRSCNVEYIDMYEAGSDEYIIAVNLVSPLINRPAFIKWGLRQQGLFYDVDLGDSESYFCHGVVPYEYGFIAAVADSSGVCDIITISQALSLHSRIYLKQSSVEGAKLLFTPNGYYCFLKRGSGLSTAVTVDFDLQTVTAAAKLTGLNDVYEHKIYNDTTVFAAGDDKGLRLLTERGGDIVSDVSFGGEGMCALDTVKLGSRLVAVCEADKVCGDCPEIFGGKDIWVSFLY